MTGQFLDALNIGFQQIKPTEEALAPSVVRSALICFGLFSHVFAFLLPRNAVGHGSPVHLPLKGRLEMAWRQRSCLSCCPISLLSGLGKWKHIVPERIGTYDTVDVLQYYDYSIINYM